MTEAADPDFSDTQAAEYVLGTLDHATATALADAMRRHPPLRAEIAAWERRLMPLAALVPDAAAPADSWDRLQAALDRTPRRILSRPRDDGAWDAISPGVERKLLWNADTFLLRVASGGTILPHRHPRVEHCVVIDGSMVIDGQRYGPGDYHGIQAGIPHSAIHAPDGLLLLIRQGD